MFDGYRLRDTFIMEYCGEVCTAEEFVRRKKEYHKDNRRHYYFMSLKSDEVGCGGGVTSTGVGV